MASPDSDTATFSIKSVLEIDRVEKDSAKIAPPYFSALFPMNLEPDMDTLESLSKKMAPP